MKAKNILDENAKDILFKIINGASLKEIKEEYQIDPKTVKKYYRDLFDKDERSRQIFDELLLLRRKKTSSVKVDKEEFKNTVKDYLNGLLSLKEAAEILGIHQQTFKKKMEKYVEKHDKMKRKYEKRKKFNYDNIDFEPILIEMLEKQTTQRSMEQEYDLVPKTLSKKIRGLKKEKPRLYKACKILGTASMEKKWLNDDEERLICAVIKDYKKEHEEVEK